MADISFCVALTAYDIKLSGDHGAGLATRKHYANIDEYRRHQAASALRLREQNPYHNDKPRQ